MHEAHKKINYYMDVGKTHSVLSGMLAPLAGFKILITLYTIYTLALENFKELFLNEAECDEIL